MKIRFKRYGKIEEQARGVTARRLAAAKRALQRERDKLPLFADMIAETQPSPEERINKVDAGLIKQMIETRHEIAAKWRKCRADLRAMPQNEREHLLWYWNRSMLPGDTTYLSGLIRRWTQKGWRPEVRNEEEEQRKYAIGRVRLAILFERWHKAGRSVPSPVDVNAACTTKMQTAIEWKPAIIAKMVVEGIQDFSQAEILRVFQGCTAVVRCVEYVDQLLQDGALTLEEITSFRNRTET